jgi:branched-chain amino acid transport system permease protein
MSSLGFNIQLHRALAFTLAGFVAGLAGVLNIWWNGQIDPTSISIGPTLDLLIIAVIGGIAHLEGAWLGAFIFVAANIYLRDIPILGDLGGFIEERLLAPERFNTVIGVLLLVIMLLSPDGIAGIIARVRDASSRGGDRTGGDGTDRRDDSAEALNSQTTGNHTMEGTIP